MQLNKQKFLTATPAVTREYTPGSRRNSRKTKRLPSRREMRPDSPALHAEQCLVPNQIGKSLDFLDGITESPPDIPHKSIRTLMAPKECEIARCSPHQLEMMTNPPALASEQCPSPDHTGQLAWLPLANSRDSIRHPSQIYRKSNFS